ncbi:MAG: hypothetical protein ABSG49_01970 [Methanoregula sp.]|jgi:hypothetical protein|uniref:hypothetical protein n=1 Tax=Methanoregula sp. TaxID=2052170 RepID=UPI003C157AA0
MFSAMARPMRLLLLTGIGLLILGAIYLIISFVFFGYRLAAIDFLAMGMGFIGFVMAWPSFEDDYKRKLGVITNENDHQPQSPPPTNTSQSDIDEFCKSVIAWKVSATKKDEIFELFRDNPYYLMGYLAYITKKDIEETKALQKKIIGFTLVSIIVAAGSMAFAGYAINPAFIIPGIGVYALVLYGIFRVLNKSK